MKKLFLSIVVLCAVTLASAQDVVTLTVNGQGTTKDVATANALRSAIEQAFGVFVSANTQILNDSLVKDEIATISSGNIQQYTEVSCVNMPNGEISVTLSATVAIGKLVAYAKNKGSSAEFAGQTFAMDMKMLELNKQNEKIAMEHMLSQLKVLAPHILDWELEVGQPTDNGNTYKFPIIVTALSNDASDAFYRTLIGTLQSLSLTIEEVNKYRALNKPIYTHQLNKRHGYDPEMEFNLRNSYLTLFKDIANIINISCYSFVIKENGIEQKKHIFNYGGMETAQKTQIMLESQSLLEKLIKHNTEYEQLILCSKVNPVNDLLIEFNMDNLSNFTTLSHTYKKHKELHSTTLPQEVLSHNLHIEINKNNINSLTRFDITHYERDLSDYLYYPAYEKLGDHYIVYLYCGINHLGINTDTKIFDKDNNEILELIIPEGIDKITDLKGCSSLKSIVLPNSVVSISNHAFCCCHKLTTVVLGKAIGTIGNSAFRHCECLQELYCKSPTPPSMEGSCGLSHKCKIYVPQASVVVYKSALGWSNYDNQIFGYDFSE